MISSQLVGKSNSMGVDGFIGWFQQNREGLLIGLGAAVGLVIIMLILRRLGEAAVRRDPEGLNWHGLVARALARTGLPFMIFAAAEVVTSYTILPHRAARLIQIGFVISAALQGAVWVRELIFGVIGRKIAEEQGAGTLANALSIMRVLISVALFAVAGILILENLDVNVTALLAGLGIGGIAIGLAAQGIFSDLFAALSILFDKPFRKGDTIRYDQSIGTVERIGLKTTRLRAVSGEQLVMANTKLLEREIHNLAECKVRRVTLYLAVRGDISKSAIDAVSRAAQQAIGLQKGCKLVRCVLSGVGRGSLGFELAYDDGTRDAEKVAADRAAILQSLITSLSDDKLQLVRASEQPPAPLAF